MAKLFSEKLKNLENEIQQIRSTGNLTRLTDCETKLNQLEAKINQLIDEITPILNSHANALKELMTVLNGNGYDNLSK